MIGLESLTTSATLLNWEQIHDLVWDKKTDEIRKRPFATILKDNEFKILRGQLIENYDVFWKYGRQQSAYAIAGACGCVVILVS